MSSSPRGRRHFHAQRESSSIRDEAVRRRSERARFAEHDGAERFDGEVPERLKGLVSKTSVRVTVPGVRIPPSPIVRGGAKHGHSARRCVR